MDSRKPNYKLQRVFSDGYESTPRLYSLDKYDPSHSLGRRDFLKTSILPLGSLLLAGCGSGGGTNNNTSSNGSTYDEEFFSKINSHMELSKVLFSPDSTLAASIGSDMLILWGNDNLFIRGFNRFQMPGDAGSGREVGIIKDIVLTPDNSTILVATATNILSHTLGNRNIFLSHVISVTDLATILGLTNETVVFSAITVTSANQLIVCTETHGIHYWDLPSVTYLGGYQLPPATFPPNFISIRPQGDALLTGEGTVVYNLTEFPSGNLLFTFGASKSFSSLGKIEFSPDGNSIVYILNTSDDINRLIIWDYTTQSNRFSFTGNNSDIGEINSFQRFVFAPDGRLICQVNRNDTDGSTYPSAVIIDVTTGEITDAPGLSGIDVLSGDGTRYMSAGYDLLVNNNNSCPDKNAKIYLGNVDIASTEPSIQDGYLLFSSGATDSLRAVILHSTIDARGSTVYKASRFSSSMEQGAVCTCNVVWGALNCDRFGPGTGPGGPGGGGGGTICTCNTVCTCVPVYF